MHMSVRVVILGQDRTILEDGIADRRGTCPDAKMFEQSFDNFAEEYPTYLAIGIFDLDTGKLLAERIHPDFKEEIMAERHMIGSDFLPGGKYAAVFA